MAVSKRTLDRYERMFLEGKKDKKRGEGDPRKQRYAKLVARTSQKYEEIARARGIPVKPVKKDNVKE
jgi:hypothetical protein